MRERLINTTAAALLGIGEAFLLAGSLVRGGDLIDALRGDWLTTHGKCVAYIDRESDRDFRLRIRRRRARIDARWALKRVMTAAEIDKHMRRWSQRRAQA